MEYAIKKLNYLLDADPLLVEQSRINLIVVGPPNFIQTQISKADTDTFKKLLAKLNKLESMTGSYKVRQK